jgi:hypothetical protein
MSRSAQWGLVSLIFGDTMLMAAPTTLVLAAQIWAHADKTPAVIELHAWFARFGSALAIFSSAAGIFFGVKGYRAARVDEQPLILSAGGLILSSVATLAWLMTSCALLNTTESMLHLYGKM